MDKKRLLFFLLFCCFLVASSRKQGDTEVILIDIALPVLESGRYAIEFSARENVTDSRSVVTRTFIIK